MSIASQIKVFHAQGDSFDYDALIARLATCYATTTSKYGASAS